MLSTVGDVIHVDDVVIALQFDPTGAAQRLSRWAEQGWLRRVGRGAYVAASIDTMGSDIVLDDPWVLVPALFAPAYIGGRTAAGYWDLTEQIFMDIFVMTSRPVRQKRQERHGTLFSLKHTDERKIFGTENVWRHQTRVPVSDVHRTIVDMLDDPVIGGGIRHAADCLAAYLRRDDRDDGKVVDYAAGLGNGAVFKRLGFLAEHFPGGAELGRLCKPHLSGGHAKLDPAPGWTTRRDKLATARAGVLGSRGNDKREILATTRQASLIPHVVEKDHVLGRMLAGIHGYKDLSEGRISKGGTCLNGCFFEAYRFSAKILAVRSRRQRIIPRGFPPGASP